SGIATLRLKSERSIYQVDTPMISIEANEPARVRIGVADTIEVGVRLGRAVIEGGQGKTTLHAGDYLSLRDPDAPYDLRSLPRADSWERWNDERDREPGADTHPVILSSYPVYVPTYTPPPPVWFSIGIQTLSSHRSFWGGRSIRRRRW